MKQNDRLISFDEYLQARYSKELNRILIARAEAQNPELSAIIIIGTGAIRWSSYRYLRDDDCIEGHITYDADVMWSNGKGPTTVRCYVKCWTYVEGNRITCEIVAGRKYYIELPCDENQIRLDKYFIPIATPKMIRQNASNILFQYCSNAFLRKDPIIPAQLARAMGLDVIALPLYGMNSRASILVTETMYVDVCNIRRPKQFESVRIKANTIILNTSHKSRWNCTAFNIAHECYHYAGHPLFSTLQKIARKECPKLAKLDISAAQENALSWLEWQADMGSMFLRYPSEMAERDLEELLANRNWTGMHAGEIYETIITELAQRHSLPVQLVRNVLLFNGHTEAKGACNHVNGRYAMPFAFDVKNCKGNATYVISFSDMMWLYSKNSEINSLLKSGLFIYADGHICVNSPEYVRTDAYEPYLTDRALRRIDLCALKFFKRYERRAVDGKYTHGCLACDEENIKAITLIANECFNKDGLVTLVFQEAQLLRSLPYGFAETLKYHREANKLTQADLADQAGLNIRTIIRIERHETAEYPLATVIALATALKLQHRVAFDFFAKAGYSANSTPAGLALEFIISNLCQISAKSAVDAVVIYKAILESETPEKATAKLGTASPA